MMELSSSKHSELIDITARVQALIPPEIAVGICTVSSMHTTAGITVNENADPDLAADILMWLDRMVPWENSMFRHCEGNSAAHIKASLLGFSQVLPVRNGKLQLGTWQAVYFCEFDGPRQRRVEITCCPQ